MHEKAVIEGQGMKNKNIYTHAAYCAIWSLSAIKCPSCAALPPPEPLSGRGGLAEDAINFLGIAGSEHFCFQV